MVRRVVAALLICCCLPVVVPAQTGTVVVPNVLGKSRDDALKMLAGQNMGMGWIETSDRSQNEKVVEVAPPVGTKYDPSKRPVVINIAIYFAPVPNLVLPAPIAEITATLQRAGFRLSPGAGGRQPTQDPKLDGQVASLKCYINGALIPPAKRCAQDPFYPYDIGYVTYALDKYSVQTTSQKVPSVVGMTFDQAKTALGTVGMAAARAGTTRATTDTSQNNKVADQSVAAGQNAQKGGTVQLTVYEYKAPPPVLKVPTVVGMTFDQAKSALVAIGMDAARSSTSRPAPNAAQAGKVAEQNVAAGQPAQRGGVVQLTVYDDPASECSAQMKLGISATDARDSRAMNYFDRAAQVCNTVNLRCLAEHNGMIVRLKFGDLTGGMNRYDQAVAGPCQAQLAAVPSMKANVELARAFLCDQLNKRAMKDGTSQGAISYYSLALKYCNDREKPPVLFNRAVALYQARNFPAALADLEQTLRLNANYPDARTNACVVLFNLANPAYANRDYRTAQAYYNRGKDLCAAPDKCTMLFNSALSSERLNDLKTAQAGYSAALSCSPSQVAAKAQEGMSRVAPKTGPARAPSGQDPPVATASTAAKTSLGSVPAGPELQVLRQ